MTNNKPPPKKNWTEQEKWVWEKLCAGEEADFNNPGDPEKEKLYGKDLDPKKDKLWNFKNEHAKNRILSLEFLETILLEEPYRNALTRIGVKIIGAWFTDTLDLSFATLEHQLWLNKSRFDVVVFSYLKSKRLISFVGSNLKKTLHMEDVELDGILFLKDEAQFAEVILIGAKIGGTLEMDSSKFISTLDMDKINVKSSLSMRDAEFKDVDLRSANISDQLSMNGSKFRGKLNMDNLRVSNSLLMRRDERGNEWRDAEFNEVILRSAKIGGQLSINKSKF